MEIVTMYEHEGVRIQLPRELIDYSEGVTMGLPKGNFKRDDLWRARRLRMTFFRRLQRNRPGLQYQWPDYPSLMKEEIIKYTKKALTPHLLTRWDEIRQKIPRLFTIYMMELKKLFKLPEYLLVEHNLPKAAVLRVKKAAIVLASQDPRTLGEMEEFVHNRAFYGAPTKPTW